MSYGPEHYDRDRLESILFNPIDRPGIGNMLSSYLDPDSNFESRLLCGKCVVEGELNYQSSIANIGNVFSIIHINARSLLKSLDKVKLIMMNMQTPPSVIGITETWLNDATSELHLHLHVPALGKVPF